MAMMAVMMTMMMMMVVLMMMILMVIIIMMMMMMMIITNQQAPTNGPWTTIHQPEACTFCSDRGKPIFSAAALLVLTRRP
eukprot:11842695-Heterocapsa_arctica.AAC.1